MNDSQHARGNGGRCRFSGMGVRRWVVAVVAGVAMACVSLAATADLPWHRLYESCYEFRVRNYLRNVDFPERILAGMDNRGSMWLCGYLDGLSEPDGLQCVVKCDVTGKLTLTVRGADSSLVAGYAASLYSVACDTVTRYGDEMCTRMVGVVNDQIDSLPEPTTDSLQALQKQLYEMRAVLLSANAGGKKYVDLLNVGRVPMARLTPSRGLIVLLSLLSGMVFCLLVYFFRGTGKKADGDEC